MDRPERELTRQDFFDEEEWARYQHEGGLLRRTHRTQAYVPTPGNGPWAQLVNMTHDIRDGPVREYRRQSTGLKAAEYERLRDAVAVANLQSVVLNAHITVAWSTAGVLSDGAVDGANKRFVGLLRHWLSERKAPHAWFWVHERKPTIGLHTHIVAHVPEVYQHGFKVWVAKAFQTATGSPAVDMKGRKSVFVRTAHDNDWRRQQIWFDYLLKGLLDGETLRDATDRHARHDIAERAKLSSRGQGAVDVKRSGFARAVGPKVVEELSWRYPAFAKELASLEPIGDRFLQLGDAMRAVEGLDI